MDKLKLFCDLMIAVSLDGGAIATLGVPWVPKTELIWFLSCLQGCFEGVINIGKYQLTNSHIISTFMAPQLPNYLGMLPKVLDFKFCLNQKFLVLIKKPLKRTQHLAGLHKSIRFTAQDFCRAQLKELKIMSVSLDADDAFCPMLAMASKPPSHLSSTHTCTRARARNS